MRDASTFSRRILLCTVGLAPQIVTETLYALCMERTPPFLPTEIHVITTAQGEARTRQMLLNPPQEQLAKFEAEFGFPVAEALTVGRIHVVQADGVQLGDISTEAHNKALADLIIQTVHEVTRDDRAAIHFSIAGGRKTMGVLLGLAVSLFARPQDSLSHVLVEPQPLEQHPEFFFPPRIARDLEDKFNPGVPISTDKARIVLAEIPFVRLRQGLPMHLLEGAWSFTETVARAQAAVTSPELVIDRAAQKVSCQGIIFELTPMQFSLYSLLAKRRLCGMGSDGFVHWTEIGGDEFIAEIESLPLTTFHDLNRLRRDFAKIGDTKQEDPRPDKFEQAKARLNERIRERLGHFSPTYEVKSRKARSQSLLGLDLPVSAIRFGAVDDDSESN
ncbi:CRISPR-associated protein, NE0113 family [Rhodomicrobium vannielii ATCC 17100]|uniref:CRISPR-associated protein, NE0113 family n=1 Tax=Rhodomicrobium vannielii (strain ATCC 17100 / DSM 162 / LMG 4299 / NCIMB 10020 / ATH 3.1.1) TaxID=648757 RepID=E3I087_RHOVT|nr:CRISPR-associated ring nuclease Csm6 [Rhodomicrobium vannielii]ADP71122.1 CRISPR-associated protein, NE0113 family [Rhodomicrobium vannielii ATCC 17100]